MKFIICALVQIEFECNEKRPVRDFNEALSTAVYLAINPNYHTVEEGISLTNVTATSNQTTFNFPKQ